MLSTVKYLEISKALDLSGAAPQFSLPEVSGRSRLPLELQVPDMTRVKARTVMQSLRALLRQEEGCIFR